MKKKLLIVFLVLINAAALSACRKEEEKFYPRQFIVSSLEGSAFVINDNGVRELKYGMLLYENDSIATDIDTTLTISADSAAKITVGAESEIMLYTIQDKTAEGNNEITSIALKHGNVICSNDIPLMQSDIFEIVSPDTVTSIKNAAVYTSYDISRGLSSVGFVSGDGLVVTDNMSERKYMYSGRILNKESGSPAVVSEWDENSLPSAVRNMLGTNSEVKDAFYASDKPYSDSAVPEEMNTYAILGINNPSAFNVFYGEDYVTDVLSAENDIIPEAEIPPDDEFTLTEEETESEIQNEISSASEASVTYNNTAASQTAARTPAVTSVNTTRAAPVQVTVVRTTPATAAATSEWTETEMIEVFYFRRDTSTKQIPMGSAPAASSYGKGDMVIVVASTNNGYYKLKDGSYVNASALSSSEITTADTTGADTRQTAANFNFVPSEGAYGAFVPVATTAAPETTRQTTVNPNFVPSEGDYGHYVPSVTTKKTSATTKQTTSNPNFVPSEGDYGHYVPSVTTKKPSVTTNQTTSNPNFVPSEGDYGYYVPKPKK